MATLQPFIAIRPNPDVDGQLVTTRKRVESVSASPLPPLKDLLETPARQRPESPQGQQAAYEAINWSLKELLSNNQLVKEESPALYIYETEQNSHKQTGLWAMTRLSDYHKGHIKVHENTLEDSVRRIGNYRKHIGIEGSPVLLAYEPNATINQLINCTKARSLPTTIGNEYGVHRIWKISDQALQNQLIEEFQQIGTVYLADGHHRLASASSFENISSLYLSFDELRIREYHRIVLPDSPVKVNTFIQQLKEQFELWPSTDNQPVAPTHPDEIGLCILNNWIHLKAKQPLPTGPETLQENILAPLLGITDPQTDTRLKCTGGNQPLAELLHLLAEYPDAIGFTLAPLSITDLKTAADQERILPPKSTWIDPKIPYGLIICQHSTES